MKRKRLTVMWMPSVSSGNRIHTVPYSLLYLCVTLLVISWLSLGLGGYLGNRLYHVNLDLQKRNSYLLQKEKELETLRHTMAQIQIDESVIRSLLGLDSSQAAAGNLGQGGEPSLYLASVHPNQTTSANDIQLFKKHAQPNSIVGRAQSLQEDLKELVEAMRDQRQNLDSTPSIIPVKTDEYWFSSGFGWRRSPFTGLREFHNGLDICGRMGTPIIAPADGTVSKSGKHRYLGKYLRMNHGSSIITTYGHLSGYNVKPGQKVRRGEVIGFMGNTGRSSGTHLHYTVRVKRKCVNPLNYILNSKRNHLLELPI